MRTNKLSVSERIDNLSDGGKFAIVLTANAFRFGGNWSYMHKDKDGFNSTLRALAEEKPNVKIFKVSNGAVILTSENYLAYNVNSVVPNAINGDFVQMAKKRREEEVEKFNRLIKNVVSGKSKYGHKVGNRVELKIGVFSINDTNTISVNGVDYPAYKLSAVEVLSSLDMLSRQTGKRIEVRTVNDKNEVSFNPISAVFGTPERTKALYNGMEISPTETGVFMSVVITV